MVIKIRHKKCEPGTYFSQKKIIYKENIVYVLEEHIIKMNQWVIKVVVYYSL